MDFDNPDKAIGNGREDCKYQIAPDGDTILILEDPNAPFAVWPTWNKLGELHASKLSKPWDTHSQDSGKSHIHAPEIRYRLSSAHLILASSYFKNMLQGPWAESQKDASGKFVIKASDWDEEALSLLMNAIHGYSGRVPRSLPTESLAKMAALVDYYQCRESISFFSDTWMASRGSCPVEYNRELLLRLAAASVFNSTVDDIRSMATVVVWHASAPFNNLSLPIDQHLIERMDQIRIKGIEKVMTDLFNYINSLSGVSPDKWSCKKNPSSQNCAIFGLGSLVSVLQRQGILFNRPKAPFVGFSCFEMKTLLQEIMRPEWYDKSTGEEIFQEGKRAGFKSSWGIFQQTARPVKQRDYEGYLSRTLSDDPQSFGTHVCQFTTDLDTFINGLQSIMAVSTLSIPVAKR